MNRQTIILITGGVALLAICLTIGFFLVTAVNERNTALEERNAGKDELDGIYSAKVFPNKENIAMLQDDKAKLDEWWQNTTSILSRAEVKIEAPSPVAFKQTLQETVRELAAEPGALQGRMVTPDFYFGFDNYLGQSDSLPKNQQVAGLLATQLTVIKDICKELYAAKIVALTEVQREHVEDALEGDASETAAATTGRRRRGAERSGGGPVAAPKKAAGADFYNSQRFVFGFQARPSAFVEVLNRLARMPRFCTVASVDISREKDLLQSFQLSKSGKKEDETDLAEVPHGERIKTDPELEPPLTVKLEIDVYTF